MAVPRLPILASFLLITSPFVRADDPEKRLVTGEPGAGEPVQMNVPNAAKAGESPARDEGFLHLLEILETLDAPVFTRNSLQFKYEWTELAGGAALGVVTFKPVFVFGGKRELALRIEAPVLTRYSNDPATPTVSGFGSITTTLVWAFYAREGIHQSIGLELQWNTATNSAVGAPWIVEPVYTVVFRFSPWLALSVEVNWQKSFASLGGYNPVDLVQLKPTLSFALPAWFFLSAQENTSWNLETREVGLFLKVTAGRFLSVGRDVALSVEYETPLNPAAGQAMTMMVGAILSYYYGW